MRHDIKVEEEEENIWRSSKSRLRLTIPDLSEAI